MVGKSLYCKIVILVVIFYIREIEIQVLNLSGTHRSQPLFLHYLVSQSASLIGDSLVDDSMQRRFN